MPQSELGGRNAQTKGKVRRVKEAAPAEVSAKKEEAPAEVPADTEEGPLPH